MYSTSFPGTALIRDHDPVDTLKTTTPLVNKVLLQWLTDSYIFHNTPEAEREAALQGGFLTKPRGIGFGIGLAFALFAMQGTFNVLLPSNPLNPDPSIRDFKFGKEPYSTSRPLIDLRR